MCFGVTENRPTPSPRLSDSGGGGLFFCSPQLRCVPNYFCLAASLSVHPDSSYWQWFKLVSAPPRCEAINGKDYWVATKSSVLAKAFVYPHRIIKCDNCARRILFQLRSGWVAAEQPAPEKVKYPIRDFHASPRYGAQLLPFSHFSRVAMLACASSYLTFQRPTQSKKVDHFFQGYWNFPA